MCNLSTLLHDAEIFYHGPHASTWDENNREIKSVLLMCQLHHDGRRTDPGER